MKMRMLPPSHWTTQRQRKKGIAQTIDVLANDYDLDGDQLVIVSVTSTSPGVSVVIIPDNTLTYKSPPGIYRERLVQLYHQRRSRRDGHRKRDIGVTGLKMFVASINFESRRGQNDCSRRLCG